MAKKSAADLKKEGAELGATLAKVKKKQHNCAVLLSKDGIVIEVHLKKSPEILLKAAKKAGGMPKGVWGVMRMEGQIIIVDPVNDKIPGKLTKAAKKYFTERGLKCRLEILEEEEAEGGPAVVEEEVAPEAATAAPEPETEEEATPPSDAAAATEESAAPSGEDHEEEAASGPKEDPRKALKDRLKALQPDIDVLLADKEHDLFSFMVDETKKLAKALEENVVDGATRALDEVESYLEEYGAFLEKKTPFMERLEAMNASVQALLGGLDKDLAREVKDTLSEFNYNLGNSEWISAGLKLDRLKEWIEAAGVGDAAEAETGESGQSEGAGAGGTTEGTAGAEGEAGKEEPIPTSISGSVGRGGKNAAPDARAVQNLLNKQGASLAVDGLVGPKTIGAITSFQQKSGGAADGRVDVDGKTWAALNGAGGTETEDAAGDDANTAEQTTQTAPASEGDDQQRKSDLVSQFAKIKNDLSAVLKQATPDLRSALMEMAQGFAKAIGVDDLGTAESLISTLKERMEQAASGATDSPEDQAKRTERLSRIAEMKKGLGSLIDDLI